MASRGKGTQEAVSSLKSWLPAPRWGSALPWTQGLPAHAPLTLSDTIFSPSSQGTLLASIESPDFVVRPRV